MRKRVRWARALVRLYPRAWRARYGDELMALVDDGPLDVATKWDLARSAGAEWRCQMRRSAMLRSVLLIAGVGVAFVLVSTLTTIDYRAWLWLNSGFGLLVTATAFVRAAGRTGWSGWWRGFSAAAAGSLIFVVVLLAWIYIFADRLVQFPFDHYDYISSGAGSVGEYLSGRGWTEFWTATALAWGLMLPVFALVAAGGSAFAKTRTATSGRV
jgi:hypothetical protein